jgi:hypothetical protein
MHMLFPVPCLAFILVPGTAISPEIRMRGSTVKGFVGEEGFEVGGKLAPVL